MEEFLRMWNVGPWGKQVITDFYALELMLALWMITDAATRAAWTAWLAAIVSIAAMPVFGAMPAAIYWLLRGL